MYTFQELYYHNTQGIRRGQFRNILALDPGETTGAAFLHIPSNGDIALSGLQQISTKELNWQTYTNLYNLICKVHPDIIVVEDYRVFSWKRDQHIWSALHTPKLIGLIIALSLQQRIPITFQTPQQADRKSVV